MDRLAPGAVVAGRYEILGRLGEGGMGVVYEALQRALGRRVALKVLRPGQAASLPAARARFEREARVAATLRHPSAVEIYDFGQDAGLLYLAMERLEGTTLRDAIASGGRLAVDRIVDVARQVTSVLVEAHAIGLVHRDLKPSNIFLEPGRDGRDRVVVADFGLAFIQDSEVAGRMTRDGLMSGTPAYVSPEQALGRQVGPPADLYSLGCTLFEMACGRPPFVDESEAVVVSRHLFAHPPDLRSSGAPRDLPQSLEGLVLSLLAKRPEERPDADTLLSELDAIGDRLGTRERSRGAEPLLGREERMIGEAHVAREAATLVARPRSSVDSPPALRLAVLGGLEGELRLALAAGGVDAYAARDDEDLARADVVYAPGASPAELAALAARRIPLITDTDPSDMARIAALLRSGVDEALPRPVRPEDLERRARRALGRRRRQ